ncbi:unnamed protein product [Acanthoscelides obtectus]|uniref:Uncharacterized protein n=1 Tax=Acanthoscelides obtectus TaxID=200917 RepID=A0A9P0PCE4_ACAOB|nr:unnamed protein product [Acanthoscelides obtectus]CAK1632470.1 hypothetical protein AOBTE_LOCUS7589 [Acanthoscelides obtectus]
MWWLILLIALQPISGAAISQLEHLQRPLWEEDIAEELLQQENDINENPDMLFRHRFHHIDQLKSKDRKSETEEEQENLDSAAYPAADPTTDDISSSAAANILRRVAGKRALAMFARWGSVNSIGKNRPPIRSHLFDEGDAAQVAARGRMLGQPLRWG